MTTGDVQGHPGRLEQRMTHGSQWAAIECAAARYRFGISERNSIVRGLGRYVRQSPAEAITFRACGTSGQGRRWPG
jgi:hypothetical protein